MDKEIMHRETDAYLARTRADLEKMKKYLDPEMLMEMIQDTLKEVEECQEKLETGARKIRDRIDRGDYKNHDDFWLDCYWDLDTVVEDAEHDCRDRFGIIFFKWYQTLVDAKRQAKPEDIPGFEGTMEALDKLTTRSESK